MDLELGPLQRQVQHALRQVLARAGAGPETPSGTWAWWSELAELGVFSFGVPAADGGLNLGQRVAVLVAEELGRALVVSPALDTMLTADAIVLDGGGSPQRRRLEEVADGRLRVAAVGLAPPAAVRAEPDGDGAALWAEGAVAGFADGCDALLVATSHPGQRLFLVPASRAGWSSRRLDTPLPAGLALLSFAGLRCAANDELPAAQVDRLVARGRLRHGAYLLGLARAAHDAAVAHAHHRRQFGRRLIEFQVIGMRLAALAARLQAAGLAVQRAAWLDDAGTPSARRCAGTLAMAAELAQDAAREAIQVHGALGTTLESPVQRYYRASLLEAMRWGRPTDIWREAGRAYLEALDTPAARLSAGPPSGSSSPSGRSAAASPPS